MDNQTAHYHGANLDAARRRARKIEGSVVYSWREENGVRVEWGYYSDPDAAPFLRNGERIVSMRDKK